MARREHASTTQLQGKTPDLRLRLGPGVHKRHGAEYVVRLLLRVEQLGDDREGCRHLEADRADGLGGLLIILLGTAEELLRDLGLQFTARSRSDLRQGSKGGGADELVLPDSLEKRRNRPPRAPLSEFVRREQAVVGIRGPEPVKVPEFDQGIPVHQAKGHQHGGTQGRSEQCGDPSSPVSHGCVSLTIADDVTDATGRASAG